MNHVDKLNKAVLNVINATKDSVDSVLMDAVNNNHIKLENPAVQLPKLLSLVKQAIDAGYHRSNRSFVREVNGVFKKSDEEAVAAASKSRDV